MKTFKKPTIKKKKVKKGKLKPITSLFDFSIKMEDDCRYEKVLIQSYNCNDEFTSPTLTEAKKWLDEWIDARYVPGCSRMVIHINRFIREFNDRH